MRRISTIRSRSPRAWRRGPAATSCLRSLPSSAATARRSSILDNAEHVLAPVAALVEHLVTSCPDVHVLATSREPFGLAGEVVLARAVTVGGRTRRRARRPRGVRQRPPLPRTSACRATWPGRRRGRRRARRRDLRRARRLAARARAGCGPGPHAAVGSGGGRRRRRAPLARAGRPSRPSPATRRSTRRSHGASTSSARPNDPC